MRELLGSCLGVAWKHRAGRWIFEQVAAVTSRRLTSRQIDELWATVQAGCSRLMHPEYVRELLDACVVVRAVAQSDAAYPQWS